MRRSTILSTPLHLVFPGHHASAIMLSAVMLSAIMLSSIMLRAIMLSAVMLNAIMLNVVMFSVAVPFGLVRINNFANIKCSV